MRIGICMLTFFCRFKEQSAAEQALQSMNGFMLAGRPIRIGLGSERNMPLANTPAQAFSGSGFDTNSPSIDRVGSSNTRARGNASSLDDTDVAGISYNKVSRESLMRKLMRTEDKLDPAASSGITKADPVRNENTSHKSSRCIVVQNMFDAEEWVHSFIKSMFY